MMATRMRRPTFMSIGVFLAGRAAAGLPAKLWTHGSPRYVRGEPWRSHGHSVPPRRNTGDRRLAANRRRACGLLSWQSSGVKPLPPRAAPRGGRCEQGEHVWTGPAVHHVVLEERAVALPEDDALLGADRDLRTGAA